LCHPLLISHVRILKNGQKKSPVTCRKQRALIFVNRPFLGTQYIRFQTALFSRRHSRAGGNPERKI
ncbi:hypothetical protein ACO4IX_002147, partial [Neisseria gonorrhoeae]